MNVFEIILLSFGLAADAFATSICKGLELPRVTFKHMIIVGLFFGIFQGLMPLIGYFIGDSFSLYTVRFNNLIAFILLSIIGINMIHESFSKDEIYDNSFSFKNLFVLAFATSIDAFTSGITFSLLDINIPMAIFFITIITFITSVLGVKIGSIFGYKYKSKAEFLGGVILILLGLKLFI